MKRTAIAIAVGAVLLSGCTEEPILGVLNPTTGQAEAYGRSVAAGIDVALAEARAGDRLPPGFVVHRLDTNSDPLRAVAEYLALVEKHDVKMVLGGVTTAEAEALIPAADDERVPVLSPSGAASHLATRSRYFYRLFPTDEVEGRTAARHLYDRGLARTVLVYTDDSIFTRGLETEFRQHFQFTLGGRIVDTVHLSINRWRKRSKDLMHAHHPDAVYIVGHGERILEVLEHLYESGYDGIRCTTSNFYLADVLARVGEAADSVIFPLVSFDPSSPEPASARFVERYQKRFGTAPDIFAAHGYDSMRVALNALVGARRLDGSALRRFMSFGLTEFKGVTGVIAFDERGQVPRYPIMHCVWQGRVLSCDELRRLIEWQLDDLRRSAEPSPGSVVNAVSGVRL